MDVAHMGPWFAAAHGGCSPSRATHTLLNPPPSGFCFHPPCSGKVSKHVLWLFSPYLPRQRPDHWGSLSSWTILSNLPILMSSHGSFFLHPPFEMWCPGPISSLCKLSLDHHIAGCIFFFFAGCIFDHTSALRTPKFVLKPLSLTPGPLVTPTWMLTAPHSQRGCIRIFGANSEGCRLADRQEGRAVHPGFQQDRKQGCSWNPSGRNPWVFWLGFTIGYIISIPASSAV